MFSTQLVINHINTHNFIDASINEMSTSPDHLEPFDNIKQYVQGITSLFPIERFQLLNLLSEYHDTFSNRLEHNRLYICHFNIIQNEPFKIKPNPVRLLNQQQLKNNLIVC